MAVKTKYKDIGTIDYKEAWEYQEKLFDDVLSGKRSGRIPTNYMLFCEHPHVYTLGKSGQQNNLLIDPNFLEKIQATYYKINRGGDITYHGPGQIVGYPIIDLEQFGLQVRKYIHRLEDSVIATLKEYHINSSRLDGATGVWLDADEPGKSRKICAIGVRASHFVTMHGFAFNVNTDLNYFNYINPCGFQDKGVTSMENELGRHMDMEEVKQVLKKHIGGYLNMEFIK
ncbi:MAG: lipoyl(octanoyl) transferase LipB [Bacteroidales bacterium]|nr:lipoyl(octanoyl) transferase LipB [Bacteroidales bacterium]